MRPSLLLLAAARFAAAAGGPVAGAAERPLALLQALDKVVARTSTLEAPLDVPIRFGTLRIVVRVCHEAPPEEPPENAAFLEIDEVDHEGRASASTRAGCSRRRRASRRWSIRSTTSACSPVPSPPGVRDRLVGETRRIEARLPLQRVREAGEVAGARHLHRAETGEVRGDELGVEQAEPAGAQARDQVHQRHLARVAFRAEHALAEEGGAQHDAVEAAGEPPVAPGLDAVGVPLPVQRAVGLEDRAVDPGFGPAPGAPRAAPHDAGEFAVHGDLEVPGTHRPRQPARHVEAVQRNDAALLRVDPEDVGLRLALGHGEEPAAVGPEDQRRRELDRHRGFRV